MRPCIAALGLLAHFAGNVVAEVTVTLTVTEHDCSSVVGECPPLERRQEEQATAPESYSSSPSSSTNQDSASSSAASMPMMLITTSSSMSVKPRGRRGDGRVMGRVLRKESDDVREWNSGASIPGASPGTSTA